MEKSQQNGKVAESILFVDDDDAVCQMAELALRSLPNPSCVVSDGDEAWRVFERDRHDIVFTDLHLPGIGGHELLRKIKKVSPSTDLIVVTGFPTLRSAIDTLKDGAVDYLLKPIEESDLRRVVERCMETRRLRLELRSEQLLRRKYEELSELKTNLLSNISHELRTPLHVILGYADLLASSIDDPDQLNDVARLADGARGLAEMVENLITLTQIDSGMRTARLELTDVETVLQRLGFDAGETAREKGLRMEVDVSSKIGSFGTDPDIVQRFVTILLENSLKFTRSGEVRLRAWLQPETEALEVEISDTGIGIPEEGVDTMFEDFRQGDSSSTRRLGGMGLGLSVVRRLVELLNGTVCAANKPGEGAIFRVLLPKMLVDKVDCARDVGSQIR